MMFFDQLKRDERELRFLSIALVVGMGTLIGGLWQVQILSARNYQSDLQEQTLRTVRIPAGRGRILDRNGFPLAENHPVFSVELYLSELGKHFRDRYYEIRPKGKLPREQRDDLERTARYQVVTNIAGELGRWLGAEIQFTEKEFHNHYLGLRALPFPLLENLRPDQVARFAEQPGRFPGLELQVQPLRVYPYGNTAAHLLGYLRRDDSSVENEESFYHYRLADWRGQTGMEARFDTEMRGLAGTKSMTVNRLGYRQEESYIRTPDPGADIVLAIDLRVQQAAEEALGQALHGEEVRGAAVVLDTRNGDLLALASAPAYAPQHFVAGFTPEQWKPFTDPVRRPLINRAMQENFLPGSIFKIVTALAALEAGAVDFNEVIHNPGFFQINQRRIGDEAAPGDYDFKRAFIKSSNTYFIFHALRPGVLQRIVMLGENLHLGERTDIIPRQEAAGLFPNRQRIVARWSQGDTANLSIGQGPVSVTPLQMAVMTAAIANGGVVFWPRLAIAVQPTDPESSTAARTIPPGRVRDHLEASPAHLRLIRDVMRADVEEAGGTGHGAWLRDFTIGGKTGTAQVERQGQIVDRTAWFVSFAPVEQPRYAVVVMVESGLSGGRTCAPVAKRIYQKLIEIERADSRATLTAHN